MYSVHFFHICVHIMMTHRHMLTAALCSRPTEKNHHTLVRSHCSCTSHDIVLNVAKLATSEQIKGTVLFRVWSYRFKTCELFPTFGRRAFSQRDHIAEALLRMDCGQGESVAVDADKHADFLYIGVRNIRTRSERETNFVWFCTITVTDWNAIASIYSNLEVAHIEQSTYFYPKQQPRFHSLWEYAS